MKFDVTVIYESEPEEAETAYLLRRARGWLGYGKAWKFKDALWDFIMPYTPLILLAITFLIFRMLNG